MSELPLQCHGVVLWDIDGTILSSSHRSVESPHISAVLKTGIEPSNINKSFDGSTDYEVIKAMSANHYGEDKLLILNKCFKQLDEESALVYSQNSFKLCLGMPQILSETRAMGWDNGILTGNTFARMQQKLEMLNILNMFNSNLLFTCKFGDSREAIAQKARNVLSLHKIKKIIIIGDTPRDISVAKKFGFHIISVATGKFSVGLLNKYNPSLAINDLENDRIQFLKFIKSLYN